MDILNALTIVVGPVFKSCYTGLTTGGVNWSSLFYSAPLQERINDNLDKLEKVYEAGSEPVNYM